MKKSWLIQRLKKPTKFTGLMGNPFSFGGGLRNGGFTKEAMDILKDILSFDYMGASEFEYGAAPEALSKIFENVKDFVTKKIKVAYRYIDYSGQKKQTFNGAKFVWIICHKDDVKEVCERVKAYGTGQDGTRSMYETKEYVGLAVSLAISPPRFEGWIEISNGYMFFCEQTMYRKMRDLLGIKE